MCSVIGGCTVSGDAGGAGAGLGGLDTTGDRGDCCPAVPTQHPQAYAARRGMEQSAAPTAGRAAAHEKRAAAARALAATTSSS